MLFGFFARRRRVAELRDLAKQLERENSDLHEQNRRLLLLVGALRDVNADLDKKLLEKNS